MVRGCRYVIAIPDMERSSRFYRDVLGFEVRESVAPGWRSFVKGACVTIAGECRDAPAAEETSDHSYFAYWQVDGIDRWYQNLCAKQVSIVKPLRTEPWGMREFGIRTIDGHRIMFSAAVQTPGAWNLRPARVAELDALVELGRRSWLSVFAQTAPFALISWWARTDRTRTLYAQCWAEMWVLEEDGALIGLVQPRRDEINGLWVHPDRQATGAGTLLLQAGEESIRRGGHQRAWLTCLARPEHGRPPAPAHTHDPRAAGAGQAVGGGRSFNAHSGSPGYSTHPRYRLLICGLECIINIEQSHRGQTAGGPPWLARGAAPPDAPRRSSGRRAAPDGAGTSLD